MKLEGWTAGVWRWMIFSRGSQRIFSSKTAVKALDRDLGLYSVFIWGNTPTFCAHVIVSNLLDPLGYGHIIHANYTAIWPTNGS